MRVKVEDTVWTVENIINFLSKFPAQTKAYEVTLEANRRATKISIAVSAEDVSQIECGDCFPGKMDILIETHTHD